MDQGQNVRSQVRDRSKVIYAHSGIEWDKSDWQLLVDHLNNVAELAKENASYTKAANFAYLAGLLHDLGKYSFEFQKRLEGGKSVDHATAGAQIAIQKYGNAIGKLVAYIIAGHHSGLANGINNGYGRASLTQRLEKEVPPLDDIWQDEIELPATLEFCEFSDRDYRLDGFKLSFLIRILFSCVVDADYIDTELFYAKLKGKLPVRGEYPRLIELKERFDRSLEQLANGIKMDDSPINRLRHDILQHVRKQAQLEPGLFSLTVPTGGGKTLTSMAFALDHAIHYKKRRIIYVIPFTSIIEQNAEVFRKAFADLGDAAVLEHHSNFDDSKFRGESTQSKLNLAMENWDMPVIVTTAVQFFESLFADRTAACRKLHNITGSVIVLDEAQLLPLDFLLPIVAVISELAANYKCSLVLCTATQPALLAPDFKYGFHGVRELAPNPDQLFAQLTQVEVSHLGELSDEELIAHLDLRPQILVIVNNRRHAQFLYKELSMHYVNGVFCLSTLICAAHRRQILETIKKRLQAGLACRLVSTSLIEAGVDVDFPCVYREEAGLDSIMQAAGRCNRERKSPKVESHIGIFRSVGWNTPYEIELFASGLRQVLRRPGDQLLSREAVTDYFREIYWRKDKKLDDKNIISRSNEGVSSLDFPFQDIAAEFKLIRTVTKPIFIPWNEEAKQMIAALGNTENLNELLRHLQPYIVQIPQSAFSQLQQAMVIEVIAEYRFGEQFWQLVNLDLYDINCGLSWDEPHYLHLESTMIS